MSSLLSCANCWYNSLQHDYIGSSAGYCVELRLLLKRSDETTCGRHLRKDLLLDSALREAEFHKATYGHNGELMRVLEAAPAEHEIDFEDNVEILEQTADEVTRTVLEYGEYHSKRESLAQLRRVPGIRAELAMVSLARGYVHRCCQREGSWTSGLHLFWWTRKRLDQIPSVDPVEDFRYQLPMKLKRQVEMAKWTLLMHRIVFLSDVGTHAAPTEHPVSRLGNLAEEAAISTETVSFHKLLRWVKTVGIPRIEGVFPLAAYRQLADELHQDSQRGVIPKSGHG